MDIESLYSRGAVHLNVVDAVTVCLPVIFIKIRMQDSPNKACTKAR
jgi:hypothetical protein